VHHFGARGLYDGGLLLGDRETGSFWQHLTGKCVHGPLKGHRLEVYPLQRMSASQVLDAYPDSQIALSHLSLAQRALLYAQKGTLELLGGRLPPGFQLTMGQEDDRLPRMVRGLAVWTDRAQRFYPLGTLRAHGNAVLDTGLSSPLGAEPAVDGHRLLVVVDPASGIPTCLYTKARKCCWQEDTLVLDNGEYVRGAVLYDAEGKALPGGRPLQSSTCWYVYAFTFPGGEIYAR
jgi:hypothetical protein